VPVDRDRASSVVTGNGEVPAAQVAKVENGAQLNVASLSATKLVDAGPR